MVPRKSTGSDPCRLRSSDEAPFSKAKGKYELQSIANCIEPQGRRRTVDVRAKGDPGVVCEYLSDIGIGSVDITILL